MTAFAAHTAAAIAPAALVADPRRPMTAYPASPVHLFSRRGGAALARLTATRSVLVFNREGILVSDRRDGQVCVQALTAARMRALKRLWPVAVIARQVDGDAHSCLRFEPRILAHCPDPGGMSWCASAPDPLSAGEAPDKAGALRHVLRWTGAASALVVGDDADDEPAFAAAPTGSVTVRVGGAAHTPTAASYRLDTQSQVTVLLSMLLALRR